MTDQKNDEVESKSEVAVLPENDVSHLTKQVKYLKVTTLFCLVISLVAVGISLNLFQRQPSVVTFDLRGTISTFLEQVAQLDITEEQKNNMVKRFDANLQNIVKSYTDQNIIVLSNQYVVSDVEDKTMEIRKEVARRMREK